MSMLTRSVSLVAMALGLAAAELPAQQTSQRGAFQWYVGGSGGVLSFQANQQSRSTVPLGGVQMLVTARRTGLLVSVENGFADNEIAQYDFTFFDASSGTTSTGTVPVVFNDVRKYSAMLVAYPIKAPIEPYLGVGGGFMHTTRQGPDDELTKGVGSFGFASLLGGVQINLGRLNVFGQYQLTSAPGNKTEQIDFSDGSAVVGAPTLIRGITHTISGGLRVSLGSARETMSNGGY